MFITILIILIACIAVGLFQILFNELETKPYKRRYYELLFKLNENPNDIELKHKALEAGSEYYRRFRSYKINTFKGAPASVNPMNPFVTMDEKILLEDMTRLTKTNNTIN
ncbi:hypothetical protein [Clostridium sp. BL-8]|uniref:hypothetical protein n=1 Tax=Clostridium sp. BL-8 TaxID=349938 RepID=UPI00098C4C4D|nr:hypothetical protein [Clostridium sp. BL-8]OOM80205.1 hypothetical protein CLOBL_12530 [Clostridium sp. BL-8]